MSDRSLQSALGSVSQIMRNIMLLTIGSILCALSVNGVLIPQQFFGGGFTGIALVIHYLIPSLPVAVLYLAFNIPVFALGWMYVGRRFFFTAYWAPSFSRLPSNG